MDLGRLEHDWKSEHQLRFEFQEDVNALAARLAKVHTQAMSGKHWGPLGYLYRRQAEVIADLKSKLREKP